MGNRVKETRTKKKNESTFREVCERERIEIDREDLFSVRYRYGKRNGNSLPKLNCREEKGNDWMSGENDGERQWDARFFHVRAPPQ